MQNPAFAGTCKEAFYFFIIFHNFSLNFLLKRCVFTLSFIILATLLLLLIFIGKGLGFDPIQPFQSFDLSSENLCFCNSKFTVLVAPTHSRPIHFIVLYVQINLYSNFGGRKLHSFGARTFSKLGALKFYLCEFLTKPRTAWGDRQVLVKKEFKKKIGVKRIQIGRDINFLLI